MVSPIPLPVFILLSYAAVDVPLNRGTTTALLVRRQGEARAVKPRV